MYDPSRVDLSQVVAPPYDVINPQDQQRYYRQDPRNVVRLIAGEVRPTDSAEDNKYVRAARFFSEWLKEGILRQESQQSLYLYRHRFHSPVAAEQGGGAGLIRQGLLGVVQLEPFGDGILPHERTHARAKADRLSLTRAVRANLSPIFCLYEDPQQTIPRAVDDVLRRPSRFSIEGEVGERHSIWSITDQPTIRTVAKVLESSRLYVADGHHRYETALNFQNKMRLENPEAPPDAAFNFVLMLLVDVDDPGLMILPTHRIIHDLQGFDPGLFLESCKARGRLSVRADRVALLQAMQEATAEHRLGLAIAAFPGNPPSPLPGGTGSGCDFFTLDIAREKSSDPVQSLDVSTLHREVLEGVLGLTEQALEEERYVGYSRDLDAVLGRVASGSAQAAFVLRPPAVSDVVAVASAGEVMPQKSTYFYPKPASGIVFNPLDPEIRIPAV